MTPVVSVPFSQFASEVLRLYQAPARRIATRRKVAQVMAEFGPLCPASADLTAPRISDWMAAHPGRSASTHRSLLSTLRAACAYGVSRRYLDSPFDFRRLAEWLPPDELDEAEPFRRHRSPEEVRSVLATAASEALAGSWKASRLQALVFSYAFTGASKNEILGLRTADVDLNGRIITIRSHAIRRLKTRARAARLPVPGPLAEVLTGWMPRTRCEWLFPHQGLTGPWFNGGAGKKPLDQIKALGKRAGVENLTILSLRHTVGTLAEGWGIGELMLQRLLRHSRPTTQLHYRHQDLDQLRRAGELVRYD